MKWIIRLIGVLLVIVIVAGVSVLFLPADRIAKLAADQIRLATGRNVSINGDVSLTLWPVLGVSADGLEVGNADWARQGPMLTAENTTIGLDARSLLVGEIRFTRIEATRPTIRLESRKDGRASWIFTDGGGEAQIETATDTQSAPQPVLIERLEVTDATLIYDAEGSDLVSYSGVDLTLDWPDRLGTADISASLRPAESAVQLSASIGRFADFIAGELQLLDVSLTAAEGTVRILGRGSLAGEIAGQLSLDLKNSDAFLGALGLPEPGLPPTLGQSVAMVSELTLTPDRRLSLRALDADLGGNRLRGGADINLNGTPQINAQFQAGALDLRAALDSGGSGGTGATGQGWSRAPIDASGLAAFDGQIALTAQSVDLGQFKLGATRTLLRNERSRMVFELREVMAYDGTLSGEFVVNNRSGLSMGGNLQARNIGMQAVLRDAIDFDRLTGAANAELSFLASGSSVHALMNSISGNGAIAFGKGTIIGIDLDRLMRSGQVGGGTTVFDSLTASFKMDGGVLRNDDLLLSLSAYEARGAGEVGLGAQTLDYTFTPIALRANSGAGIAIPVRIRGPWSSPRILPDVEAAIELNFAEEKEKLKQEAEAALRRTVAEELKLGDGAEADLEGAVQDKLEKEISKGLRKLFD